MSLKFEKSIRQGQQHLARVTAIAWTLDGCVHMFAMRLSTLRALRQACASFAGPCKALQIF